MRKLLTLGACVALAGCAPTVTVPYFGKLHTADLCGEFSKKCQPLSSRAYQMTTPIDYSGAPSDWLGRKFSSIFERQTCGRAPQGEADVATYGNAAFSATVVDTQKANLKLKLGGNVRDFVDQTFRSLPAGLKAVLLAETEDVVNDAVETNVEISYQRVTLTQAYMDTPLKECLGTLQAGENAITGISVIKISGNWASRRIQAATAKFELTAEYNAMSAAAKADYARERDMAITGTFDPMSFVFAVAYTPART